jgi:hypothetical protein
MDGKSSPIWRYEMYRLMSLFVFVFLLVLVSGCAVPVKSSLNYTPPTPDINIDNEILVKAPFDEVWQKLITGLSSEFFVITNIEKASGLITLDFGSDQPDRFVECGETTRTYGDETITYDPAGSSTYHFDGQATGVGNVAKYTVNRSTSLSGKINVHVAEMPDGTKALVNARYILTTRVGGFYNVDTGIAVQDGQKLTPETFTKSFNTNSTSQSEGPEDYVCCASGELEKMILDIIRE